MEYTPTIGLEVHAQLNTVSKIFCTCSTTFGGEQNTQICPVCLGLPGVLPVLNEYVVERALQASAALNCTINPVSIFARKNYFYPDLPKGYQISQFEEPLAEHGHVEIPSNGETKRIGITRIHLEEDAGKSMHPEGREGIEETRIDVNRCGVPLIEIVSEPDIRSPREAHDYLTALKRILLYLGVSDCNMEEGSLRCDANISLMPHGASKFGTKTELKNLNSFRYVEKALEREIARQKRILNGGGVVVQQTLSYDESTGGVIPMRSKEESDDYRYFPEPDLMPLQIGEGWLDRIRTSIPELPRERKARFMNEFALAEATAETLTAAKETADYFEEVLSHGADPERTANWMLAEVFGMLNEMKLTIERFPAGPKQLAGLLGLMADDTISGKIAKSVFREMVATGKSAEMIVEEKGLKQITDDTAIERIVDETLKANPDEVGAYLGGKEKLIGFFVGQVMKATKGKAHPGMVNKILKEKLDAMK